MNILFQTRKPRRVNHEMIYCVERKERLKLHEEHARRGSSETSTVSDSAVRLHIHRALKPALRQSKLRHTFLIIVSALLILLSSAFLLLIL